MHAIVAFKSLRLLIVYRYTVSDNIFNNNEQKKKLNLKKIHTVPNQKIWTKNNFLR